MKRFLVTTAIVTALATPLAAESHKAMTADDAVYSVGEMNISASNLLGQDIYSSFDTEAGAADDTWMDQDLNDPYENWEELAEIDDVMISEDGKVSGIVTNVGGFLGMGERNVQISMDDLKFVRDGDDEGEFFVVYTGDPSKLKDVEEYNADKATEAGYMSARNLTAEAKDDMATDRADTDAVVTADKPAVEPAPVTGTDTIERPSTESLTGTDFAVDINELTADDLEGARVYGSNEDWVGEIGKLVIDDNGKISKAVIDVGGFLGMGERPVAVGFDQLNVTRDQDGGDVRVYINATEEELENLPEYED